MSRDTYHNVSRTLNVLNSYTTLDWDFLFINPETNECEDRKKSIKRAKKIRVNTASQSSLISKISVSSASQGIKEVLMRNLAIHENSNNGVKIYNRKNRYFIIWLPR